ncbi:hypothetical protein [Natronobacterium gregoryi]|uniref:hypothetical protein n=1 Tax=Natronobacterium gregoryi TaxID=44930 RepID=UPI0012DE2C1D|nr:hypothetical protein [Natronobacterium gregoryi]
MIGLDPHDVTVLVGRTIDRSLLLLDRTTCRSVALLGPPVETAANPDRHRIDFCLTV